MEVHLTPEQEARLAQVANNAGTDAERLVKGIILDLLDAKTHLPPATELPIWHLGATSCFHRRDLYDDVH